MHPLSSSPKSVPRVLAPPKRALYCARHSVRAFFFFFYPYAALLGKSTPDRFLGPRALPIHLSTRLLRSDGIKIFSRRHRSIFFERTRISKLCFLRAQFRPIAFCPVYDGYTLIREMECRWWYLFNSSGVRDVQGIKYALRELD